MEPLQTPLFRGFHENSLPPGQAPIVTSNVEKMHSLLDLVLLGRSLTEYASMAILTSPGGWGKTIAAYHLAAEMNALSATGLPSVIVVKVENDFSPIALASNILKELGETPMENRGYQLADRAGDAMVANDLKLLIVDEADRLNRATFELLRQLLDKTGCPIVLVGLPRIKQVISVQEKFNSRVGARVSFEPMQAQEIVKHFLPKLVLAHWEFDPQNTEDQAMGYALWKKVSPSLRNLRKLLVDASVSAELRGAERITSLDIAEALSRTDADKQAQDGNGVNPSDRTTQASQLSHSSVLK
ncbi:MAG TPA: AAA family ATPase [Ktedonobacteraceae bacterium]